MLRGARLVLVCLFFFATIHALTARARAQESPVSLLVPHSAVSTGAGAPRDPDLQLAAPNPELWRAARQARLLLAAGIGTSVSTAVHVAWAGRDRVCGYDHRLDTSLRAAAIFGVAGLSFTIGGGTWLGILSREQPGRASQGQIAAATGIALATAVATQAVLTLLWGIDATGCSS